MIRIRRFSVAGATVNVTITGTSANVAITAPGRGTQGVRIANVGTQTIFVAFGKDSTVTATAAAGVPILSNTTETFNLPNDITYVAAIAGSTGSVMYVTTGE